MDAVRRGGCRPRDPRATGAVMQGKSPPPGRLTPSPGSADPTASSSKPFTPDSRRRSPCSNRTSPHREHPGEKASFWHDPDKLAVFYQSLALAVVILVGYYLFTNTLTNLARQNIATGFGFLGKEASFEIGESLIPYSAADSYVRALAVGILNTLKVACIGIFLTVILGTFVGIARLSSFKTMRLVVLPQALKIVIPPTVSILISAFKDTSLVVIIALYDILKTTQSTLSNPRWMGFSTEAYIFLAVIYFICCFFMSNWSRQLEKDLST